MSEAKAHRRHKERGQRRWLLLLLSAVLICLSGPGAQAHGIHAPPSISSISVMSQPQNSASLDMRTGDDCPAGGGHVDHGACAGVSCHAAASGVWPVADYQPRRCAYERLVATVGDGRVVAPLFHPPKV